jgi:very-short-patch-repair endonuclease
MVQKQHRAPREHWQKKRVSVFQLRAEQTPAEDRLWQLLRNRQMEGQKFRRQYAIGRYVVDFYCAKAYLIIEIDGAVHQSQVDADRERQGILETMGFHVLRFSNDQVLNQVEDVLQQISEQLKKRNHL